jgi:hypothetical protein
MHVDDNPKFRCSWIEYGNTHKKGNYFPTAAGLNIEIPKKGNNFPTPAGLNIEIPKGNHSLLQPKITFFL